MVKQNKGFTLIELLIIIGIIGFLAAAILVAVDPVRRIQEARDSRRWSEVNALLNAYLNKQVDDKEYYFGYFTGGGTEAKTYTAPVYVDPLGVSERTQIIVSDVATVNCLDADGLADFQPLCGTVAGINNTGALTCVADLQDLAPDYIASLPHDPHGDGWDAVPGDDTNMVIGAHNTGYYVHRTTAGRIKIGACNPEQVTEISVQR